MEAILPNLLLTYQMAELPFLQIRSPGEALTTFIRGSGDPKRQIAGMGSEELKVVLKKYFQLVGILRRKIIRKYLLNKSKTTLKKFRIRFFRPQNGQN